MTRDAIENVRLLAPSSVRTDEVARARQWRKLANAMTEEISSSCGEHPSHRVRAGASLRDGPRPPSAHLSCRCSCGGCCGRSCGGSALARVDRSRRHADDQGHWTYDEARLVPPPTSGQLPADCGDHGEVSRPFRLRKARLLTDAVGGGGGCTDSAIARLRVPDGGGHECRGKLHLHSACTALYPNHR